MYKTTFNATAIKKICKKEPLQYGKHNDNIIAWDKWGIIAISCNPVFFELEIKNKIPTAETEIPDIIIKTFDYYENTETTVLYETFLLMELQDKTARIYQNYKHNYFTPIDSELLKILNNLQDFTPYQAEQNKAVLFKNDFVQSIIMPLHNKGIKEKLQDIAAGKTA